MDLVDLPVKEREPRRVFPRRDARVARNMRGSLRAALEYRPLYTLRHIYTLLMLYGGKSLHGSPTSSGDVGVKRIDKAYGRWKQRDKLLDHQLDLDSLFRRVRTLPPRASTEAQAHLKEISG
jgi:hypothetical protein